MVFHLLRFIPALLSYLAWADLSGEVASGLITMIMSYCYFIWFFDGASVDGSGGRKKTDSTRSLGS